VSRVVAGRYRLLEVLGRGGMGEVWRATDDVLHRSVAVKILEPDRTGHTVVVADARDRFIRECRLAARLNHPNIVSVFDAGEDANGAFLVMECLPGPTLRDRIAAGPLSDGEARRLGLDVLAALGAAHEAGIVHRDVKPANVLNDGADGWKVADFGIAKGIGRADDLTRTGQVLGTLRYLAPERLAGTAATPASDLYSVGVILREALSGRADAHRAIDDVANRAMHPDPAQRFASAETMAAALCEAPVTAPLGVSNGPAVTTDLPTGGGAATAVLPTLGPPRRRRRGWVAALCGAMLAASIIAAVLAVTTRSNPPPQRVKTSPPSGATSAPAATTTPASATASTGSPTVITATSSPATAPPATGPPTKPHKPPHGHRPHKNR